MHGHLQKPIIIGKAHQVHRTLRSKAQDEDRNQNSQKSCNSSKFSQNIGQRFFGQLSRDAIYRVSTNMS